MNEQHNLHFFHKSSVNYHSELRFLHDEVKFLKSFLKNNFSSMLATSTITRAQLLHSKLAGLNLVQENVTKDLLVHQGNLQSVINEVMFKSTEFLKIESERIEEEIKDLNRNFKNIKKEIFSFYKNATDGSSTSLVQKLQFD